MANPSEFDVYFHGLYGNIDIDLDIFVHSEFDVYLSDVELARFSQANRFTHLRFMFPAIMAHRQVLNRRRLVQDNRRRVTELRSELIRVLVLFPELRDEIVVELPADLSLARANDGQRLAMDYGTSTSGVRYYWVGGAP